ncbi:GH22938 [Drosophila grimshawi]|uniref:GH22938 n=1 Tax=Drosophila grimshawi TaxID=7222 RepID=B4JVY0_DROGR|nr:GH22938 [Drosophila grimshawi]
MVSARLLHSVMLNEFCKMTASPAVSRNLACGRKLDHVKRNLFGSAQTTATTTSLESKTSAFSTELDRYPEYASQKWGYDFRADRPLGSNATFIWERVSTQESHCAPPVYTLTRAAHVRPEQCSATPSQMEALLSERADRENLMNSSLDSNTDTEYDSQDEPLTHVASTSSAAAFAQQQQRKRQLKITEFMKERKRLAQAPKKISPAKRMRTNSGSSSSVGAQFGCHLKRSRHN